MADGQRLDLEVERLRTEEVLRHLGDRFIALAVAAATAFHQVHGNTRAIVSREDYDDALNIAASALSRLIPIFHVGHRQERTEITVHLTTQRFDRGATRLRASDGSEIADLCVRRSDLMSALSLIKRTGLPFSFATVPAEPKPMVDDAKAPSEEEKS